MSNGLLVQLNYKSGIQVVQRFTKFELEYNAVEGRITTVSYETDPDDNKPLMLNPIAIESAFQIREGVSE